MRFASLHQPVFCTSLFFLVVLHSWNWNLALDSNVCHPLIKGLKVIPFIEILAQGKKKIPCWVIFLELGTSFLIAYTRWPSLERTSIRATQGGKVGLGVLEVTSSQKGSLINTVISWIEKHLIYCWCLNLWEKVHSFCTPNLLCTKFPLLACGLYIVRIKLPL